MISIQYRESKNTEDFYRNEDTSVAAWSPPEENVGIQARPAPEVATLPPAVSRASTVVRQMSFFQSPFLPSSPTS